jgi:hypothetical protein
MVAGSEVLSRRKYRPFPDTPSPNPARTSPQFPLGAKKINELQPSISGVWCAVQAIIDQRTERLGLK